MSLLDSIVDLILGYSDIDFEKIIQEERGKSRPPPRPHPLEDRPHTDRKQHCPRRLPDSYRITTRQPPAPRGSAHTGPAGGWEKGLGVSGRQASRLPSKATWP